MAKHLAILEMENNQLKAMLSQQNGGTIPTLPPPPTNLPPSSFASMLPPLPDIDGCDEDFDEDDDDNQSQNYNQKNNRNHNNNNHKTSSRASKKRKLNNGASIQTNDELSIPMNNINNNNTNMVSSNDSSISPQFNQFIPKQYSSTNSQDENDATEESSLIIPNNHLKWALPEMSQTEDFKPENGNMKLSSSLPPPPPLIPMMGNIPHQIGQPPISINHNRLPPQISNSSSLPSHPHAHPHTHHLSHPHLHNHPHAHPQAFQFLHGLPPFLHNIHAQQQQQQQQQQHQQQHGNNHNGNIPPNVNLNNMNVNVHGHVGIPHNVNIPLPEGFQHGNLPPFIMPTHNGQIPQSSQIIIKPENINEHQRIMLPPFMNNNNNNNNGIMTPLNHNININNGINNNNGNEDNIKNDNTQ